MCIKNIWNFQRFLIVCDNAYNSFVRHILIQQVGYFVFDKIENSSGYLWSFLDSSNLLIGWLVLWQINH